jgi:uncharacterized protein
MIRGRCPTCARPFEVATIDDLPTFPFCSDRCRLLDLGRWIDGSYVIPDPQALPEPSRPGEGQEGA